MSASTVSAQSLRFEASEDYRKLVSAELYQRLVGRIVKDEGVERSVAEQIMDAALGFLYLTATTGGSFSPSPLVDIGWHTFILYTRSYQEFCQRVVGKFVHHEPNDNPGSPQEPGGIQRSIDAIRAAGMPLDEMLWTSQLSRRKIVNVSAGGECNVDCDNGGGGPGDECSCS